MIGSSRISPAPNVATPTFRKAIDRAHAFVAATASHVVTLYAARATVLAPTETATTPESAPTTPSQMLYVVIAIRAATRTTLKIINHLTSLYPIFSHFRV